MSIKDFKKVLGTTYQHRLFVKDDSVVWYTPHILVVDDPNLTELFGEYLLKQVLPKDQAYHLEMRRNRLQIVDSSEDDDIVAKVKKLLSEDKNQMKQLAVSNVPTNNENLRGPKYTAVAEGDLDVVYGINQVHFDYLAQLAENEVEVKLFKHSQVHVFSGEKIIGVSSVDSYWRSDCEKAGIEFPSTKFPSIESTVESPIEELPF